MIFISYVLKNTVKENGDISVGVYLNGLLVNEIVIKTDGSFGFMKQGKEIATVNESGIAATHFSSATSKTGSILIYGSSLINLEDASDEGAININSCGFQKGGSKFRNFHVYNGKTASIPLFSVEGKTETVHVNASFIVNNTGNGFVLKHKTYPKTDKRLINTFSWADSAGETVAFMGYDTADSFDFTLKNSLGNITIHPNG